MVCELQAVIHKFLGEDFHEELLSVGRLRRIGLDLSVIGVPRGSRQHFHLYDPGGMASG
jgi:hypothetical protein